MPELISHSIGHFCYELFIAHVLYIAIVALFSLYIQSKHSATPVPNNASFEDPGKSIRPLKYTEGREGKRSRRTNVDVRHEAI